MKTLRSGDIFKGALRVFGYLLAICFFGVMLVPVLLDKGAGFRIPAGSLLLLAAIYFIYMDGLSQGASDYAAGETLKKAQQQRDYTPTAAEETKVYRPMKGIIKALLGGLPFFLLALYVAMTAKPYVYTLQDLPPWLETYALRPEITAPLAYLGQGIESMSLTDIARMVQRLSQLLFLGIFGQLSDGSSLLFDRLSPLIALILPACHALGYQFGPKAYRRNAKAVEAAKMRPRKRLKKTAKKKPGSPEQNQLI